MKDWSQGKHHDLAIVRTKDGYQVARVKRGKMNDGKYLDVTVKQFSSAGPTRHLDLAMQFLADAAYSQIHRLI